MTMKTTRYPVHRVVNQESREAAQSSISPCRESVLAVVLVPIVPSASFGSVSGSSVNSRSLCN